MEAPRSEEDIGQFVGSRTLPDRGPSPDLIQKEVWVLERHPLEPRSV
jgi:hypothetical protein